MGLCKFLVASALMLGFINAEVLSFDNSAIEKIFQEKNSALFLFTNQNEGCKKAREAFDELDAQEPGVVLAVSDANDGHGLFDRLGEYLGVDGKSSPKIIYWGGENNDKYKLEGEISKDSLVEFISKVKAGEIEQFLKSAPVPESNDEPVKVVVGSTFKDYVTNSDKEVLVKYYAPWCGHCKNLAPHYDKAAEILSVNPNILLIKVDSTENEVAGVNIEGFPTLKFYGKDKSQQPIDYTGGRTAEGIVDWIKEHTEYEWVDVATKQSTEEL